MPPSEQSASIEVFPGVRPLLRDLTHFIVRPTPPERQMRWGCPLLAIMAVLLVLDWALSLGIAGLLSGAQALGYEPPPYVDMDLPRPWLFFLAIVFAPIAEELMFRGWLSGRKPALLLAVTSIGGLAAIILVDLFFPSALRVTSAAAMIAIGVALLYWLTQWRDERGMVPAFKRHYALFIWLSSLLFGAVHLTNYEGALSVVDIVMVLPQTLGGLILAYTRTRLGLRAAILHHAAFNAVALLIDSII
ncbi:CPBP family glutamic-type intramembrane protease [Sphingomicrobium flavum]|uniref:CPBP family glutamic-type intramembrane protease n=1 Tax=Sphingomicrobium flavum TaxID=1229164 RepID=UPI0021ADB89F|nr:CPBP family glutamic-type intramembrane protease [Sphingomicrobium flavum]